MFTNKKIISVLSICMIAAIGNAQHCKLLEKSTESKIRRYFLADTTYTLPTQDILDDLRPADTSEARSVIENGTIDLNFEDFLNSQKIKFEKIHWRNFLGMKWDSIPLTAGEIKLSKKYDQILKRITDLDIAGKKHINEDKQLEQPEFVNLRKKMQSAMQYMFVFFGIYHYQGKTLIIYSVVVNASQDATLYCEFCNS